MNRIQYPIIFGWTTRSLRRRHAMLLMCKNYGCRVITRDVYVGEVYADEIKHLRESARRLFVLPSEKFWLVPLCKSCFTNDMSTVSLLCEVFNTSKGFELIQVENTA